MGAVLHTPDRIALFKQIWSAGVLDAKDVLSKLNQLPGPHIEHVTVLNTWGARFGIERDKAAVAQRSQVNGAVGGRLIAERYRLKYANLWRLIEENVEPVKVRTFDKDWPDNQTLWVIKGWKAGKPTAEIAREIGATKGALIGKAHRLIDAGILTARPSPIKAPAEPKTTRLKGPCLSPTARTLPPLKSALVPPAEKLAPVPRVRPKPIVVKLAPAPVLVSTPRPRLVADDGVSGMGPSLRPCQWVVLPGSVVVPHVQCGVDRMKWPYCARHFSQAYIRVRDRREDVATNYTLGQRGVRLVSVGA